MKCMVLERQCEGHEDKSNEGAADVPQALCIAINHKSVLFCGSLPVGLGPLRAAEFIVRGL